MNRDRNPFYKRQAEPEMGNQLKRWRARTMRDTNNYEESESEDRMNKERDLHLREIFTDVQKPAAKTDHPQNWWKQNQVQ